MRLIKMIGLAAIAALAAMAFVWASTASAEQTALCKIDTVVTSVTGPCAESDLVRHVHEVDPKATFLSSIVDVHCEVLLLGAVSSPYLSITHAGGEVLPLDVVGNFTYIKCLTEDNDPCTMKETSGPSLVLILRLGVEHAHVTFEHERLVDCDPFIHCIYNGVNLEGLALGPLVSPSNGTTHFVDKSINKVSGFLCPSTTKLDLLLSPLTPVYISR